MSQIKSYQDLRRLITFEERFDYLALGGQVAEATFGFDRWVNQTFYRSRDWRRVRREVILRDEGCDLGVIGYEIHSDLLVHHINPLTSDQIIHGADELIDLDNLITTCLQTHNAIHFGDKSLLPKPLIERRPGDTKLW